MPSDDQGSITRWITGVKGGDLAAAQPLWGAYFARMVDLARTRLRSVAASGRRQRRGDCSNWATPSRFESRKPVP